MAPSCKSKHFARMRAACPAYMPKYARFAIEIRRARRYTYGFCHADGRRFLAYRFTAGYLVRRHLMFLYTYAHDAMRLIAYRSHYSRDNAFNFCSYLNACTKYHFAPRHCAGFGANIYGRADMICACAITRVRFKISFRRKRGFLLIAYINAIISDFPLAAKYFSLLLSLRLA